MRNKASLIQVSPRTLEPQVHVRLRFANNRQFGIGERNLSTYCEDLKK